MPTAADDALLRPLEAAALAGVTPRTLARWAASGLLASVRTAGGQRRYRRCDVVDVSLRNVIK
jgi:excisionase family DNA binding protein